MHAWDKPNITVHTDEPLFRMSKYGRTVNLGNKTAHAELIDYKRRIGEDINFPLGDNEYLKFEIYISRKYREEFKEYLRKFGGLRTAAITFRAASMPSNLLEYYVERSEKNGKAVIPGP